MKRRSSVRTVLASVVGPFAYLETSINTRVSQPNCPPQSLFRPLRLTQRSASSRSSFDRGPNSRQRSNPQPTHWSPLGRESGPLPGRDRQSDNSGHRRLFDRWLRFSQRLGARQRDRMAADLQTFRRTLEQSEERELSNRPTIRQLQTMLPEGRAGLPSLPRNSVPRFRRRSPVPKCGGVGLSLAFSPTSFDNSLMGRLRVMHQRIVQEAPSEPSAAAW